MIGPHRIYLIQVNPILYLRSTKQIAISAVYYNEILLQMDCIFLVGIFSSKALKKLIFHLICFDVFQFKENTF